MFFTKLRYQLNLRKFGNFKIHFDCFLFLRNRKKYFAVVLCSVDTKRKWRCRGGEGVVTFMNEGR